MNNFFFLIFIYLLEKVCLEYEKIELDYFESYYYIPLNFPDKKEKNDFIFSTKLPMSFFPSSNCSKCTIFNINETKFEDEKKYVSIPYYYYNYTGRLFNGNCSTDKFSSQNNFLAFDNISYATNYVGKGRFSLSYLNYNFNTSKKVFALKFTKENTELHLGDFDHERSMENLKTFNIVIEHIYENYTETVIRENVKSIYDNNILIEEDDNKTHEENITFEADKSVWYMSFPKLIIRRNNKDTITNFNQSKLTLDMSTSKFLIPRKFFLENVEKIFPADAKCQIARDGFFTCDCDEEFKTKFGNFKFVSENGVEFLINVTDYMSYQSSISGSRCNVEIYINYDNDLFIGGITVLNNYYSIFDVDNKTFAILPKEDQNYKQTGKYIILFIVVLFVAIALLFGGYYFYNKYVINDPTGLAPQNNNADANNNIHGIQHQNNEGEQNLGNNGNYF